MKREVLWFLIITFLLSCGRSQDSKISTLIRDRINQSQNNPERYEAVETIVDNAFAPKDDPIFYGKTLKVCLLAAGEHNDSLAAEIERSSKELMQTVWEECHPIGYKVTHTFMIQDTVGQIVRGKRIFILDEKMTKIIAEYNPNSSEYRMVQTMYQMWRDNSPKINCADNQ